LPKPIQEAALLEMLQTHLKLEWIYEEPRKLDNREVTPPPLPPSSPLPDSAIPPVHELETLLDLALMGDLKAVIAQTSRLEQLNRQYTPFTSQLQQLAKRFRGKQVIELIKHYQAPG
jgi:hypothetical protein